MKRFFLIFNFFILNFLAFSFSYKINSVTYNITGKTKESAIRRMVPIDTSRIFENENEFAAYLRDLNVQMNNTRTFQKVSYDYQTFPSSENVNAENASDKNSNALYLADLTWNLIDTKHLVIAPYPKYNSNSGFETKVKFKDTNFLGTMNTLTSDVTFAMPENSDDKEMKHLLGDYGMSFGLYFDYNFPFKMGKYDATWINNFNITYTIGHSMPEWTLNTGLTFSIPLTKIMSISVFAQQGFTGEKDYKIYNDEMFFTETANVSFPIALAYINNWGGIYYSPGMQVTYFWDYNKLNPNNSKLFSPKLFIFQILSTGRVNWENNFRTGATFFVMQSFDYNIKTKVLAPKLATEVQLFKGFKYAGLASRFYYFVGSNTSENIGSRLRGIRDGQDFKSGNRYGAGGDACDTESALVINFDVPIHIFSTHFTKNKFLKKMNFEIQVAPFIDVALLKNKATKTTFWLTDGFYAAGLEVIMNLESWKAIQVRGSIGVDVGRFLLKKFINMDWRAGVSKYEISFGIGLHY